MHRRIRSLQANRLAILLEFVELRVIDIHGGRDVACLPHIGIARTLGVVAGQGIGAIEMERSTARGGGVGVGAAGAVAQCLGLLRACRTVSADLARGDALLLVAEDVACEEVDDAEDDDHDAAGDDNLPEGGAQRFLARGLFVQVSEDGDAEDDHQNAESHEAGFGSEEGPVARDVASEER